jgi:enamine deaminase RidA (YjgF/YER057c/UK114 family)
MFRALSSSAAVRRHVTVTGASAGVRGVHVEKRLAALGHELPPIPPEPKGNYMTWSRTGSLVFLAGHLPVPPPSLKRPMVTGRLGENLTLEQGQEAAKFAGLQMLATLIAAVGDLDKVTKVVKIVGFVNSTNDFTQQANVMNGCSDLMGEVFGVEVGRHARSSIATNVLPLGVAVEIEMVVEVRD